ncbi:hypothetical protein L6164_019544 [Bauhinia variegata]|uniref:Uncharacterized protein n=1 Tax=Bauhinia variegata TaxID=167791 RepID=A0ACB9MTK0_BAUVA|nr:hypothetical protein L6164_019544 [Bauhinia variegata]
MENSGKIVGKDDVIAKLKDDGDFDGLRLKIIRKLKDNEELRGQITAVVKQSTALNRAGAENMKPRQLSDAIYEEVGDKVMGQISDSLWQIIRSEDGMKSEIHETVQSVYNKLVYPKGKDEVESSSSEVMLHQRQNKTVSAADTDDTLCDNDPNEPPGFTLSHKHPNNNHEDHHKGKEQIHLEHGERSTAERKEESNTSQDKLDVDDVSGNVPPGFSADAEQNPPSDCSDEDPDVPPGFG